MKGYTDLEQSKALAKMLPIESANMWYCIKYPYKIVVGKWKDNEHDEDDIPCWSLTALLSVLPNGTDIFKEEADTENERYICTVGIKDNIITTFGKNSVDACYEMILKLMESTRRLNPECFE